MNNELLNFAKSRTKELLSQCTEAQQLVFRQAYSHKDLELSLDVIVDNLPEDKLIQAMDLVLRTVKSNSAKKDKP